MSGTETPGFEDLEPEGDHMMPSDNQESFASFEENEIDDYLERPGEHDPFQEQEDDAFETLISFEEESKPRKRQDKVATLAARIALKWGSRAARLAANHSGGLHRRRSRPRHQTEDWLESMDEAYWESDDLFEDEMFEQPAPAPRQDVEAVVMLLAKTAVSTNHRAEAERLMAAIVPLIVQKAASQSQKIWSAVPVLIQGVSGMTRLLHSRPDTRKMLIHVPVLLNRTVAQLVRYMQNGRSLSHRQIAQLLAKQTAVTLQQVRKQQPRRQPRKRRPAHRNGYKEWWDNGNHA